MNWKDLIKSEMAPAYELAEKLIDMVDADQLDWKTATGHNWMTTGQLLMHISDACGSAMKGFVTGEWGMPEGVSTEDIPPEDMLPPAEVYPTVESIAQAKALLAKDKETAQDVLAQCDETRLGSETVAAPWNPTPKLLGYHLLNMVDHLKLHKAQLFYYLKLQGKAVNTEHLWGA